jgi:hypothetical protein
MSITVTLIIFFAAIVLAFLSEFTSLFQKLKTIPGMMVMVPLLIASFIVERFEQTLLRGLLWYQSLLYDLVQWIVPLNLYHQVLVDVMIVIFLFLSACIPMWGIVMWSKRQHICRQLIVMNYPGVILWLIGVFLMVAWV